MFGKENIGKIEEINIKGLAIQMIIVSKYNLVLIFIMDKDFVSYEIRDEAEKTLDMFYLLYKKEIIDCVDVCQFDSFKKILMLQIQEYFEKLKDLETVDIKDFGFFTDAVSRLKNNDE